MLQCNCLKCRREIKIKKIRFTVPYFMKEKIKEDEEHFNLLAGEIGNKIFSYFSNKEVEEAAIKTNKGEIIQFNLNKSNTELYDIVLKEHKVIVESEFLRSLFFKYLDNPRHIREKILYADIFDKVEEALEERTKINIKYNGEIRSVHPYFVKISQGEDRSYLFCYCDKNSSYRNYRIANIQSATLSKNKLEEFDSEYIKEIRKKFDPFLSYGKKVSVKFTLEGEELYKRAILNRPKLLEKNKDIWIFECTNKLAKVYFSQFLSKVEILEPLELRKWFKDELKNALEIDL